MSQEFKINDELAAVEAALKSLHPVASNIDRDRTMYLSGRASASAAIPPPAGSLRHWLWPVSTAVSLLLALSFGGLYFLFGSPGIEKQIVYVEVDKAKSETKASPKLWYDQIKTETAADHPKPPLGMEGMDYLSLSRLVASQGVEALPSSKTNSIAPNKLLRDRPMTLRDWETILNDY